MRVKLRDLLLGALLAAALIAQGGAARSKSVVAAHRVIALP